MAIIPELLDAAKWGHSTGALLNLAFQFNSKLNRHVAIGRVLITTDSRRRQDIVWIYRLQTRIARLFRGAPPGADADVLQAAAMLRQPWNTQRPRVGLLPSRLTQGVPVHLWDHFFAVAHLPDGVDTKRYRENLLLPCRFDVPGPNPLNLHSLPYTRAMRARRSEQFAWAVRQGGGVHLRAVVVQANNGLWEPGDVTLPACLLFTFDRNLPDPAAYLEGLARRASRIKGGDRPSDPDDRFIYDRLWEGERGCTYHERYRLPRGFTGGPVVYEASVWMPPGFLRGGMIRKADPLYVVAEPGDEGGAELLPYWDTAPSGIDEALPMEDDEGAILLTEADLKDDVLPEVDEDE